MLNKIYVDFFNFGIVYFVLGIILFVVIFFNIVSCVIMMKNKDLRKYK